MDYNIKITEIENKIPDTTGLTTTPEFNWLTKTSFDGKMAEVMKRVASQVDTSPDIADKNREK